MKMKINQTIVESILSSPCSANEITIKGDARGDYMEENVVGWLENEIFAGFCVWHLAGIILSILLSIIIGLCCCIRFRVPRTKQEIEEDYIRKKITRTFREELSKLNLSEMDEMHLRLALDVIHNEVNAVVCGLQKEDEKNANDRAEESVQTRFNTLFTGNLDHLGN